VVEVQDDLIYDLGANQGEDTEFYLAKGFRVVAVEANPLLHAELAQRFAGAVVAGRLVLLACGVWDSAATLPFYLNEDNHHWSSFDREYGTREGSRFSVVPVACTPLPALLRRFGVPRYLKLDIEGADRLVLAGLAGFAPLPRYISVEEYGVAAFGDLAALGYRGFQAVAQWNKAGMVPPRPPREGGYAWRRFTDRDSGLFGEELPGAWLDQAAAEALFTSSIRRADGSYVERGFEWWDIHAKR
jgi:FkbM family methyltransferase